MLCNTSDAIAIAYEDNIIPVFTQKSITDMYNDRPIPHGSRYDSIDAVVLLETPMQLECGKKPRRKSRVFVLQRKLEK